MGRAISPISMRNSHFGLTALILVPALSALGCQKTDKLLDPSAGQTTTLLHAIFRSDSTMIADPRTQVVLDGQALEDEWGGVGSDPYFNVRVSAEQGSGDPGPPAYVSLKAIYTDQDIFFLIRWTDPTQNDGSVKDDTTDPPTILPGPDAMAYVGPSIPDSVGGCVPDLVEETNWVRNPRWNEDRVSLAFQIGTSDAAEGFAHRGCAVACHAGETPIFGRTNTDDLDIWQWLASRTNPVRDLFDRGDNAAAPRWGVSGFLDDLFSTPVSGLQPDPGTAAYRPNFREGSAVPLSVYRVADDPFAKPRDPESCRNEWGERCRANNGVSLAYIWREDITVSIAPFSACDTTNQAPLPVGRQARPWHTSDTVPGWLLTYPRGSRADVHGKALYAEGVWTLEVGRSLNTSDAIHDVVFEPAPGRKYYFTIAIMDNSGTIHLGSEPQALVFDPKGRVR